MFIEPGMNVFVLKILIQIFKNGNNNYVDLKFRKLQTNRKIIQISIYAYVHTYFSKFRDTILRWYLKKIRNLRKLKNAFNKIILSVIKYSSKLELMAAHLTLLYKIF